MSFILDALRKSEHERQRGAVPGISNVPYAAPRRETPRWMFALVAALVVAVVALGGAWWRSSRVATQAPAIASVPLEVPPASPAPPSAPPPETRAARVEPAPVAAPPPAVAADAPPTPPQADTTAAVSARAPAAAARDFDSDAPTLPSPTALAAEGIAVPQLRLELHAYSERPAERFVFINGRKYVEGEQLAEGPRVVSIERTGAVLSQQGRRFLLTE